MAPTPLPDPPADRTGWWRNVPPPPNPDDVAPRSRWRFPLLKIARRALPFSGIAFIAVIALAALADAPAALVDVLIPAMIIGVLACIAIVLGGSVLEGILKDRREQRARVRIEAWTTHEGLTFRAAGDLPEATPLLATGDRRYARNIASGRLPGGLPGVLGGYVYEVERGEDDSKAYPHTVVVARVPETLGFLPELEVRPRGHRGLAEHASRSRKHVPVESAAFEDRFEIFVPSEQDENWVRQLFTPVFVNWLAESAPDRFLFELREGVLCVAVQREVDEPTYLEAFCWTAAFVAGRLRQEGLEAARRPASARFAERATPATPSTAVAEMEWKEGAPQDVAAASRAFRGRAARELRVWRRPVTYAAVAFVIGVVGLPAAAADMDFAEDLEPLDVPSLVAGALLAAAVFVAQAVADIRRRALEYGKEAFLRAYGRARDLVPEDPRRFHARHVSAPLPGAAEFVLTASPPQGRRQGSLVLCRDQARGSKDAEFLALVAPSGDERSPTVRIAPGERAATGPGLGLALEGGTVVVYEERNRGDPLSESNLDGFYGRASAAAASFIAERVEHRAPERG